MEQKTVASCAVLSTVAPNGAEAWDRLPREVLVPLPTPLECLPRLSAALGGPRIFVKRDDCTGLGLGGNKIRKLEYLLADARAQGADTLITVGGLQTNHGRQTAAVAARAGMECHLILAEGAHADDAYFASGGNLVLDHLFGARLHIIDADADRVAAMEALAQALQRAGRHPYVVASGGSSAVGVQGYRRVAHELAQQVAGAGIAPAALVLCSGSGGTQAGLMLGLAEAGLSWPVLGVSSAKTAAAGAAHVDWLVREGAALAGLEGTTVPAAQVDDGFVGPGYGMLTEQAMEAIALCARLEGLVLDPVYTGKAMAGLIAWIRAGRWHAGEDIVFLHTGGSPALFAYREFLNPVGRAAS